MNIHSLLSDWGRQNYAPPKEKRPKQEKETSLLWRREPVSNILSICISNILFKCISKGNYFEFATSNSENKFDTVVVYVYRQRAKWLTCFAQDSTGIFLLFKAYNGKIIIN